MRGIAVAAYMTLAVSSVQAQTNLASLRDKARPVLIFGGPHDTRVEEQFAELSAHAEDARERDLRVVLLTTSQPKMHDGSRLPAETFSSEEAQRLRRRFHIAPEEFTVLLIGKDGGEKLRSVQPVSWERLASTIDSMPMRRDEMMQKH